MKLSNLEFDSENALIRKDLAEVGLPSSKSDGCSFHGKAFFGTGNGLTNRRAARELIKFARYADDEVIHEHGKSS